jgi:hypothetical protein
MSDRGDSATQQQLEALLDALEKSLLEAPEDEVLKELGSIGVDPLKAAELMSFAEAKALEEYYLRLRDRLKLERKNSIRRINGARTALPGSRVERLNLLRSIFAAHPQTMTAQFRELTSLEKLADAELASMLEHLAALGYLQQYKD